MKNRKQASKFENEVDPSEIDLEMDDEYKNFFSEENFKNNEWFIGTCPF